MIYDLRELNKRDWLLVAVIVVIFETAVGLIVWNALKP